MKLSHLILCSSLFFCSLPNAHATASRTIKPSNVRILSLSFTYGHAALTQPSVSAQKLSSSQCSASNQATQTTQCRASSGSQARNGQCASSTKPGKGANNSCVPAAKLAPKSRNIRKCAPQAKATSAKAAQTKPSRSPKCQVPSSKAAENQKRCPPPTKKSMTTTKCKPAVNLPANSKSKTSPEPKCDSPKDAAQKFRFDANVSNNQILEGDHGPSRVLGAMAFALKKPHILAGRTETPTNGSTQNSEPLTLINKLTLQPIPESHDVFLQAPRAVDWDDQGNTFVLDAMAQRIMKWDKKGRYVGTFGQKGRGPGEFEFKVTRNSHQPTLTVLEDEIWIYDDGPHQMEVFDKSGNFKRQIRIKSPGHLQKALPLDANTLLVMYKEDQKSQPTYQVGLYRVDREAMDLLTSMTMPALPARDDHYLLAYQPFPSLQYHARKQMIIAGNPSKPEFLVFRSFEPKKITFSSPALKLQERDKCEFKAFEEAHYDHKHPLVFPEIKPYYSEVIALNSAHFLAITTSPQYGIITGELLDEKGTRRAKFETHLGEGGALLTARGKLLAAKTDAEGQFHLGQVVLGAEK